MNPDLQKRTGRGRTRDQSPTLCKRAQVFNDRPRHQRYQYEATLAARPHGRSTYRRSACIFWHSAFDCSRNMEVCWNEGDGNSEQRGHLDLSRRDEREPDPTSTYSVWLPKIGARPRPPSTLPKMKSNWPYSSRMSGPTMWRMPSLRTRHKLVRHNLCREDPTRKKSSRRCCSRAPDGHHRGCRRYRRYHPSQHHDTGYKVRYFNTVATARQPCDGVS